MNLNIAVRFDEHRVRLGEAQSTVSEKSRPHSRSPTSIVVLFCDVLKVLYRLARARVQRSHFVFDP